MSGHVQVDKEVPPKAPRLQASRLLLVASLVLPLGVLLSSDLSIASHQFEVQDGPLIVLYIAALVALTFRIPALHLPNWRPGWAHVIASGAILALALWWGTHALMFDYPLTIDEHMVHFDMAIFAKGHLVEPLAPEWRPFKTALFTAFIIDAPNEAGLMSVYWPGNAMMRMAFSRLADPALMNPLLVALSALALFDIARRLFPDDNRAVFVTMVLYLASAQVLVSAMTVYAMTGHTALNLVWLMLFLRDRPWAHALAMIISVWAIGLHEPPFHPLFAGPLLLWRLAQRRYVLFAVWTAVFVAALLFWIEYPALAISAAGMQGEAAPAQPGFFWRDRVLPLLLERDPGTVLAMLVNVIRYITWQHLALVPLIIASWPMVRKQQGPALPLVAGIIVTLAFCAVVLPYQGHGWGYRYQSAVMGNAVILGGIGYHHWSSRDRVAADGLFVTLSVLTAGTLAFLAFSAQAFVKPYAQLDQYIRAARTDMVLIDTDPPRSAIDQVRNLADLSNRPLRLSSYNVSAQDLAELCRRGTISLVTRRDMQRFGFAMGWPENTRFERKIEAALAGKSCLVGRDGKPVTASRRAAT